MTTRFLLIVLTLCGLGAASARPAMAIGCLGGSVVGAVAGHMVHHGVLGAVGGCIAGHEHQKHLQRTDMQNRDPRQDDRYRQ